MFDCSWPPDNNSLRRKNSQLKLNKWYTLPAPVKKYSNHSLLARLFHGQNNKKKERRKALHTHTHTHTRAKWKRAVSLCKNRDCMIMCHILVFKKCTKNENFIALIIYYAKIRFHRRESTERKKSNKFLAHFCHIGGFVRPFSVYIYQDVSEEAKWKLESVCA